jgi:hypothetical protein
LHKRSKRVQFRLTQVVFPALGICQQQQDLVMPHCPEVNDSGTAPLATAPGIPANLAYPAPARDYRAGVWSIRQKQLKRPKFIIAEDVCDWRVKTIVSRNSIPALYPNEV